MIFSTCKESGSNHLILTEEVERNRSICITLHCIGLWRDSSISRDFVYKDSFYIVGNNFSSSVVYKPSKNVKLIMFQAFNNATALKKTFLFSLLLI